VRIELLRYTNWFDSNTGSNAGGLGSVYSSN
jgi:hypothetical protein